MHATLFRYESWSVSACQGEESLISSEHLTRMTGGNPCRGPMSKRSAVPRPHHGDILFEEKPRFGVTESAASSFS